MAIRNYGVPCLFVFAILGFFTPLCARAQTQGTSITLTSSSATPTVGDTVNFTATVSATSGTGTPTGLVTFFDGPTPLGSGTLSGVAGDDQATFSTAVLNATPVTSGHSVTAVYDGDANFAASAPSPAIAITLTGRNITQNLVVNPSTAFVGQPITASLTLTDAGTPAPPGTPDTFSSTGAPATGRTGFTMTPFSDNQVLVAGGTDANRIVLKSAEIYSVSAGGFTAANGSLNTARTGAAAILLPNGKVLVAGGSSDGTPNGALASAELFDPVTGTFTPTSHNMTAARFATMAVLFINGQVLLAGGENAGGVLSSAELYDPATDAFTATGSLNIARTGGAAAVVLKFSQAVIAGGSSDGTAKGALESVEIFSLSSTGTGTFQLLSRHLSTPRWQPEAVEMGARGVLIAGGQNSTGTVASADFFVPGFNAVVGANEMAVGRANGSAVMLPSGRVLLAGGAGGSQVSELYDFVADRFEATGNLLQSANGLLATLLNNGLVLTVGLTNDAASASFAELYTPSFNPLGSPGLNTSEPGDGLTGSCNLTPSGVTASSCDITLIPLNVGSNPHVVTTNFFPSPASANVTVTPAVTTTSISPSANPSVFGQPLTFTATVTSSSPGAIVNPTGTVQFVVDGANFGSPVPLTASVGASGTAMISISPSTLGVTSSPHSVTANFLNADGNFVNSSVTLSGGQTVTAASTATTVTTSQNPSSFGQAVTFTATVTNSAAGSTATPTGAVQFTVDGTNFGTPVALAAAGTATLTIATLTIKGSPHAIGANYLNTDGNFIKSSVTLPGGQTVTAASTTATVTSSQNPSSFGQAVTFTVTVSSSAAGSTATPTGAVQFMVDGVSFGTPVALSAAGAATLTIATLPVTGSPHAIAAIYLNADGNFLDSSASLGSRQTVAAASTTTTVISSQNPSSFGQAVTFTATVTNSAAGSTPTPTGAAQFTLDGANFGAPVALGASGTAALTIATLPVAGSPHAIAANYVNADGNFMNSSAALRSGQTVTAAPTTTAVVGSIASPIYGQALTFTATISSSGAVSTGAPTGSVRFVVDGQNFGAPVSLTAGTGTSSSATSGAITTLAVNSGSPHIVSVVYANTDGNFVNSSGSLSGGLQVSRAHLTVTANNQSKTYNAATFAGFTATLTGFVNGETDAGLRSSGSLSGMPAFTGPSISAVNAGQYAITPTLGTLSAANYDFPVANFASGNLTILKANATSLTTEAATPINDPAHGATLSFTVVVASTTGGTPTGSVQFTDDQNSNLTAVVSLSVAACPSGTPATASCAKFSPAAGQLATGPQTITASYEGDANFNSTSSGSTPSSVEVTVVTAINTTPGATVPPQVITFENAAALAGQNLTLSCQVQAAAIPASAQFPTCSLNSTSLAPSGSITLTLSTVAATSAGLTWRPASDEIPAQWRGVRPRPIFAAAALGLPAICLLCLMLVRGTKPSRRTCRQVQPLAGLMLIFSILVLLVACGGHAAQPPPPPVGGTPAGTYLVSVVGADSNHNPIVVATLPLNVQ